MRWRPEQAGDSAVVRLTKVARPWLLPLLFVVVLAADSTIKHRAHVLDKMVARVVMLEQRGRPSHFAEAPVVVGTVMQCLTTRIRDDDEVAILRLSKLGAEDVTWNPRAVSTLTPAQVETGVAILSRELTRCARREDLGLVARQGFIGGDQDDRVPAAVARALRLAVLDIRRLREAGRELDAHEACADALALQRDFETLTGGALGFVYPKTPHWMLVVECRYTLEQLPPRTRQSAEAQLRDIEAERFSLREQLDAFRTREELSYLGTWLSDDQYGRLPDAARAHARAAQAQRSSWQAMKAWWFLPSFDARIDAIAARAELEPIPDFEVPSLGSAWPVPVHAAVNLRKQTCLTRALLREPLVEHCRKALADP